MQHLRSNFLRLPSASLCKKVIAFLHLIRLRPPSTTFGQNTTSIPKGHQDEQGTLLFSPRWLAMTSRDIQLALQEHLNNATLATDTEKLVQHLAAFSRDWKLEPSLDQLDSALQLLSETRQGASFEAVALWWLGYIQDIALSGIIPRLSPGLGQGT